MAGSIVSRARPLKVLCLDVEGGYGGSSRSLFEFLSHTNRSDVEPEVWCKRSGPVQPRYVAAGIHAKVMSNMPKVSSLAKVSRNLVVYSRFLGQWLAAGTFRADLLEAASNHDIVHCNHEGLFVLARWLRRKTRVPLTMHVRTNLADTPFARWQEAVIAETADHIIFITENERANFERLAGRSVKGSVIFNPVTLPAKSPPQHPEIPADDRFRIVSMGSRYSPQHGTDRVIDLAVALAMRGRRDIAFVIAGDTSLPNSLPGSLGRIARRGGTLIDYAEYRGVADMVQFLGFVPNPEQVLAAGNVLIMPTRERVGGNLGHPWGRAILEAMAVGLPVISVGSYDRFVETGVTGILQPEFDAEALADEIANMASHREIARRMGATARQRVSLLCDANARAADLLAVWRDVARSGRRPKTATAAVV